MTTHLYNTLKTKLQTTEKFDEIFDYFFQNFAENPSFYDQGELSTNEVLIAALQTVGEQLHGKKSKVSEYRITEIAEHHFLHGTCFLNGSLVLAIYFTDLNIGLASISLGGAMFEFVKLKATTIPDNYGFQFTQDSDVTIN